MKKCMELVENKYGNYCQCNKPAKFITPTKVLGRYMYLCGIHARSFNKVYEKSNKKKCIPLENNNNKE